jgi:hypothetical protein
MLVLLTTSGAGAVDGDINADGIVDLRDFFILADNFGETGPPEASDCGPLLYGGSITQASGQIYSKRCGPIQRVALEASLSVGKLSLRP